MPPETNSEVFNYRFIRFLVGLLAFLLPVLLVLSAYGLRFPVAPSISEFFYTPARELLVGTIGAISIFLLCYNGHAVDTDKKDWRERYVPDRLLSLIASAGALGVAFFPVHSPLAEGQSPEPMFITLLGVNGASLMHNLSALAFFAALTWFCLDNFRRMPDGYTPSPRRIIDNRIYVFCGLVLLGCTLGLIILSLIGKFGSPEVFETANNARAILVLETVALVAFAISWLTKGKTLGLARKGVAALRTLKM